MKTALVTANYPPMSWPCGVADYVAQLGRRLRTAGVDVTIVTSHAGAEPGSHGLPLEILPGRWDRHHRSRLVRLVRDRGFDLVDLQYEAAAYHYRAGPLLWPYFVPHPTARVLTMHAPMLPRGGRIWRPVQVRPFEAIVFNSRAVHDRLQGKFPSRADRFSFRAIPTNIMPMVSPAIATLAGRIKSGWARPGVMLLYFGHIAPQRGLEDLLSAVQTLNARQRPVQLVLLSQFVPDDVPYHRELLNRVRTLGLADQVSFPGEATPEQVSAWFQAADVAVLPYPDGGSFRNGSLAAALVHGTPIVTTATALTEPEIVTSPGIATYTPGDQAGLVDRLSPIIDDAERRQAMSRSVRELAEVVAWDGYVAHRLEVYEQALARRRRA